MNILELKEYISKLTGHVTFEYNGYSCGVDPLSLNSFDMWYGNDEITVSSIEEVFNTKIFNGKTLEEIWNDVIEVDF